MHHSTVIYYHFCSQTVLGEIHSQHYVRILFISISLTVAVAVYLILGHLTYFQTVLSWK